MWERYSDFAEGFERHSFEVVLGVLGDGDEGLDTGARHLRAVQIHEFADELERLEPFRLAAFVALERADEAAIQVDADQEFLDLFCFGEVAERAQRSNPQFFVVVECEQAEGSEQWVERQQRIVGHILLSFPL